MRRTSLSDKNITEKEVHIKNEDRIILWKVPAKCGLLNMIWTL